MLSTIKTTLPLDTLQLPDPVKLGLSLPVLNEGVIIIFGQPAVGKTTQGKILSVLTDKPHISAGKLLRERVAVGDAHGLALNQLMKNGDLVNDMEVTNLLRAHLKTLGEPKAFILDGTPRSVDQARLIDELLSECGIKGTIALYLTASPAVAVARAQERRQKAIAAGEKVRDDDRPEVVPNRMKIFEEKTSRSIAGARLNATSCAFSSIVPSTRTSIKSPRAR